MSRVVVIGAGMGGLAAAARLAALGHSVTICEAAPTVGGKLARYTRAGYAFDTGPSVITLPQVFTDLFDATGGPLPLDLQRLDPSCRYRFGDGTVFDAPDGVSAFAAAAEQLSPGAGRQWARLATRLERVWDASWSAVLTAPLSGVGDLLRLLRQRPRDLPAIAPTRSLRSLASGLRDPRLRLYLERYATYTGSDPRRAPAALAVIAWAEQRFGVWQVPGGTYALAEVTAERARERGVEILLDTPVTGIGLAGGRVASVRTADGVDLRTDVVVCDADAEALYRRLVATAPGARAPRRALDRAQRSLAGFVLLAGMPAAVTRALPGGAPGHHTVSFGAAALRDGGRGYDDEFDAVFGPAARPPADPALYLCTGQDGAWFVLANAPRHGSGPGALDWDTPGLAAGYAARLQARLAERGIDLNGAEVLEWRTPADLQRATGAPGGAIYGTASHGPRSAFLRPANRSPVPGLFLVGGSAHPGGGLPLVTLSARIVAGLVGPAR